MNGLHELQVTGADLGERYRRTALVLHGLTASDRDWVLAQLPQTAGSQLRRLLRELVELGLPADQALVRSVLMTAAPAAPVSPVPAVHRALEAFTAAQVHAVLAKEPDRLVAAVLAAGSWPWADGLLAHLEQPRADCVREVGQRWRAPAALQQAVLSALLRRLQEQPVDAAPVAAGCQGGPRDGWWRRLVRRSGA